MRTVLKRMRVDLLLPDAADDGHDKNDAVLYKEGEACACRRASASMVCPRTRQRRHLLPSVIVPSFLEDVDARLR
jgi:hypothetical protein